MNQKRFISPAFTGCNQCIVLCSDNHFMPATSVAIQSILENANPSNQYDIIVLHSKITPFVENTVKAMCDGSANVSIRFFDISFILEGSDFFVENRKAITQEAYYRLFIPWLLSEEYKSALYMDGDMIVRKDIMPIFAHIQAGKLISAVRDYWGICNCYMPNETLKPYRESIGLDHIDDYVISATLLFNLDLFRETYTLEDVLGLAAARQWDQHDQDVLNILCKDSIHFLSVDWGWMSDYGNNHYLPDRLQNEINEAVDPVIVHFGGGRKPWKKTYGAYDMDFWRYADHTPYMSCLLNMVSSQEYQFFIVNALTQHNIPVYKSEWNTNYHYKGVYLGSDSQGDTVIRAIKIEKNVLRLEGMVAFYGASSDANIQVFCEVNGCIVAVDSQTPENEYRKGSNAIRSRAEAFRLEYALDAGTTEYRIKIVCRIGDLVVTKEKVRFSMLSPLNDQFKNIYYASNGYCVTPEADGLLIRRINLGGRMKKELAFCLELWKTGKTDRRKAIIVRQIAHILKILRRKPIWLISDRVSKADDNGEAFFQYMNEKHSKDVDLYFVINDHSADRERIRRYGKTIAPRSFLHKILILIAEYSISSQTDTVFRNPYHYYRPYQDLLSNVKCVFLQHGVISADLSGWLARRRQGFSGFITSAEKEYKLIMEGQYNYTQKELWLTGLPRFDTLEDRREKIVTFLPTWRRYLAIGQDPNTGFWLLKKEFASSRYAEFYRSLLSDERLVHRANELGYRLQIKVHPSFNSLAEEFGFAENVLILPDDVSYKDIYAKSSLLVTDFSSAIYDFAYLHKPIVYCQFDSDDYFSGMHMGLKANWDFEQDGFGEVEYDVDGSVNRIIEYMENGCELKEKYRKRIDSFFAYNDRNNCERVYEKILDSRIESK